jgi:hypothetical protein
MHLVEIKLLYEIQKIIILNLFFKTYFLIQTKKGL